MVDVFKRLLKLSIEDNRFLKISDLYFQVYKLNPFQLS